MSTSEVNGQRPNRASRINFVEIYKIGNQICELNYRGTKFKIRDKLGNQKYNFVKIIYKRKKISFAFKWSLIVLFLLT